MADMQQLERALINADAAGDVEAAKVLAGEIRKMRAAPVAKEEPKASSFSTPLDDGALGVAGMLVTEKGRQNLKNKVAGAVRGAASIGTTLMYPVDKLTDMIKGDRDPTITGLVTGQQPIGRNEERRRSLDPALQSMGADPESLDYQFSKLGAEVAGTAGAGSALANGVRAVAPGATGLVNALASGGFKAGNTPGVKNMLLRVAGGATAGGASAGLINPEDAGFGTVVGGGLPAVATGVAKVGRKVGSMLRGGEVPAEVRDLAVRAKELGINIPADRLTDSKPMNALASSLNYVPFSGRAATEANMTSQLNRALSRTFGQDSDNVTQALRKAESTLGGQFDKFLSSNTVRVDKQFVDDLAEAANQASKELGSEGASIINRQVEEILQKAGNGQIDGQAAYNIKKTLDRIGKRNSPEAWYAIDLKQKLMEALNRSVGPKMAAEFSGLRQQYGNMLSLQKLAANGAEGDISIARLANMKNIRSPDLQELADISAQFLKSREGQHGAAQRAFAGMAAGTLGGIPALAGGAALGRGTNMLLNSNLARDAVLGLPNNATGGNRLLEAMYLTAPAISAR